MIKVLLRKVTLLLVGLFLSNNVGAQSNSHLNMWMKFSLSYNISKRFKVELEAHHRRQNDFAEGLENPFQYRLLSATRLLGHYQLNENTIITLSPFAYFWNSPIIQTESDKLKPALKEIRYSVFLDSKQVLYQHLYLTNKTGFEYRDFQQNNADIWRFRHRLGLRYDLAKWSFALWDEALLNIKGTEATHIFDHNRVGLVLGFKPSATTRLEFGYIQASRLTKTSTDLLEESNLILNLYYNIQTIKSSKSKT